MSAQSPENDLDCPRGKCDHRDCRLWRGEPVAAPPDGDEPCLYTWPDADSVREHVCLGTGAHVHSCAVCGPRVIPPAESKPGGAS